MATESPNKCLPLMWKRACQIQITHQTTIFEREKNPSKWNTDNVVHLSLLILLSSSASFLFSLSLFFFFFKELKKKLILTVMKKKKKYEKNTTG